MSPNNAASAATTPPAKSPFAGMDICATVGLRLPPAVRGPVFEQDVWDFSTVVGLPTYLARSYRRMDFTLIANPRWRLVAKEHAVALLLPGHERVRDLSHARRTPLTLQTCAQLTVEVTRWLNWLSAHAVTSLDQVTDWHCDGYAAERSVRRDKHGVVIGEQVNARYQAVAAVVELALYRELFTADRYPAGLRPFGGRTVHAVSTRQITAGNKTPVVPAEILQPVLAAALYMVGSLGPHIIAEHRRRKAQLTLPTRVGRRARGALVGGLIAAVERQIAQGRPLERMPEEMTRHHVAQGHIAADDPLAMVSMTAIAREAGVRLTQLPLDQLRPVLTKALAKVGVAYPWGRNAAPVARADGHAQVPWTEPIDDLRALALRRMLRAACIIVIAAVSGMRASELLELTVGCRQQPQQVADALVRYRITSKVIKGAPPGGLPDEWVVTKEVFDAVTIAEQLLDQPEPGTLLLAPCTFSVTYSYFRAWVNSPAGQRLGLAPVPPGQVNLRMLRRILSA